MGNAQLSSGTTMPSDAQHSRGKMSQLELIPDEKRIENRQQWTEDAEAFIAEVSPFIQTRFGSNMADSAKVHELRERAAALLRRIRAMR